MRKLPIKIEFVLKIYNSSGIKLINLEILKWVVKHHLKNIK